jgi:hypothetical protein
VIKGPDGEVFNWERDEVRDEMMGNTTENPLQVNVPEKSVWVQIPAQTNFYECYEINFPGFTIKIRGTVES